MLALTLQALETLAVIVGVVFGLVQLRQLKIQHEVQGSAAMLQSLQSADTGSTALLLFEVPDDLSGSELKLRLAERFPDVIALASMFESVGPLVARGHLSIGIYSDFYRGATVLCWRKLRRYVEEQRASGWSNLFEWFQWLAEQMERRTPLSDDVPAFERFRAWREVSDYERLQATPISGPVRNRGASE